MPTTSQSESGAKVTIFCLERAALADSAQGLPTGHHTKCTNTYHACKAVGDEGNLEWLKFSPGCNKGLPLAMCEACYVAGVYSHLFLLLTALLQFPLVFLSIRRTSAVADSRCRKFWSLPIAILVICGTCISRLVWQNTCYDRLLEKLDGALEGQSLQALAEASTTTNAWSFAPFLVAILALLGLVFSISTPVPEPHQSRCIDPEPVVLENSLSFGDDITELRSSLESDSTSRTVDALELGPLGILPLSPAIISIGPPS